MHLKYLIIHDWDKPDKIIKNCYNVNIAESFLDCIAILSRNVKNTSLKILTNTETAVVSLANFSFTILTPGFAPLTHKQISRYH